jgi:hypothetical protein
MASGPEWETPDPGEVFALSTDDDWAQLSLRYASDDGGPDPVLVRCLEVAKLGHAVAAVIETRYLDPDYRSEYGAFYASTFGHVEATAHRLHFFASPLENLGLWELASSLPYVGYVVVRPIPFARVGRAMLPPPPELMDAVRTAVEDTVNVFGTTFRVSGVPFMAQDGQLCRCAHVDAWMCHFTAARRSQVARVAVADFATRANAGLGVERDLPSEGLNVQQLLDLLRTLGFSADYYRAGMFPSLQEHGAGALDWLPDDPEPPEDNPAADPGTWDWRFIPTACRYLNSGFPVIIGSRDHTFVLCGWKRSSREASPDWIELIRHDDEVGPYIVIDDVFTDAYAPWKYLIAPVPRRLFLPPHAAEWHAAFLLHSWARVMADTEPQSGAARALDLLANKQLALRTYAVSGNDFKEKLAGRGLPSELVQAYRLARLPRFVWVVEAVDREARRRGSVDCVLGEVLVDPTSGERSPAELAIHLAGLAWVQHTDGSAEVVRCETAPYRTGAQGPA